MLEGVSREQFIETCVLLQVRSPVEPGDHFGVRQRALELRVPSRQVAVGLSEAAKRETLAVIWHGVAAVGCGDRRRATPPPVAADGSP